MSEIDVEGVLAWLLVAFFLVGAAINVVAPRSITEDYARWGYPAWFHRVTAALELTVAVLLSVTVSRLFGAALGAAIMAFATGTTLVHGEYKRAIPPAVVLVLTVVLGLIVLFRA